jgi:L-aspartate oxidase
MRAYAGPVRSAESLASGLRQLDAFGFQAADGSSDAITAANATLTARLIMTSALLRTESRGAHQRSDFAQTDERWRVHLTMARDLAVRRPTTITVPAAAELAYV